MEHFLNNIIIDNFKSIKHLKLKDCKRINLFIGPPNVGKSNILEALSLFSLPIICNQYNSKKEKDIRNLVRLENLYELFYNGLFDNIVASQISSNNFKINILKEINKNNFHEFVISINNKFINLIDFSFDKDFKELKFSLSKNFHVDYVNVNDQFKIDGFNRVFKYSYNDSIQYHYNDDWNEILQPPFGRNIFKIIQQNIELDNLVNKLFLPFGLRIVYDNASRSIKLIKEINNKIFLVPFSLIADTLQRFIFHIAAIKSNHNSILLFEEPEAQCYPPYIKELTQQIVDSTTNQFFIATHSDIVVNHFLEKTFDDTTIYMVDFKDGQTIVQSLTEQQKYDIVNDGIDIFFNRDYFLTSNN